MICGKREKLRVLDQKTAGGSGRKRRTAANRLRGPARRVPEENLRRPRGTTNQTCPYGWTNFVSLRAVAEDVTGSVVPSITWTSDIDGFLGNGASISHAFSTPGTREISAHSEVRGQKTSCSLSFEAYNAAPEGEITEPSSSLPLHRKLPFAMRGYGTDENEGTLPCGNLTWTIDRVPNWSASGCTAVDSFDLLGPAQLRLSLVDAHGLTGTKVTSVVFEEPPPSALPVVMIIAPAPFDWFQDA
jgi:hypothetical protein